MAAFSGSQASLECVRAAAEVCGSLRKDLIVTWIADATWVVTLGQPIAVGMQALAHEEQAEEMHRRVACALADTACSWRFITRAGDPCVVLSQLIADNDVDAVFVGPARALTRWFRRCVPRGLARLSPRTEIVQLLPQR